MTKERTTVHRTRCPAGPLCLPARRRTPPRPEAQTGGELVGGRRRLVAENYARNLLDLRRFEEAKGVLRKTIPVAQRVTGADHAVTLKIRWCYAEALYNDPAATLDALREAVVMLEDAGRIARRVLGGAHPMVRSLEGDLREARAALAAREPPSGSS